MGYKEHINRVLQLSAGLAAIAFLSQFAFSQETRKIIGNRDRWTCTQCGRSFKQGYMMHACHKNHDQTNPGYDTPEMGDIRCVPCHQSQHEAAIGNAQAMLGLSERDNQAAIRLLSDTPIMTRNNGNNKPIPTTIYSNQTLTQIPLEQLNLELFG